MQIRKVRLMKPGYMAEMKYSQAWTPARASLLSGSPFVLLLAKLSSFLAAVL